MLENVDISLTSEKPLIRKSNSMGEEIGMGGGVRGLGWGVGGVYLVPSSLPSSNLCILITACLSRFTIYLYDRTSHVREITFFQHYVTLVTNDIISIWKINMIHVYSLPIFKIFPYEHARSVSDH